ncbi:MAG: riboflavin synthase [Rhodospirillaceae bacterium]|nr:riboflavin synthase [Rhodospirillaceae bacterium]|tara:strand:- start:1548 stop:2138 length:591 start_codon:yes stop_codon:yes gene_type:complete
MFTGIITDIGSVRLLEKRGDTRIEISTTYDLKTIDIGASIACSGPCLTVVEKGLDWFAVEASAETLNCTTIGTWIEGTNVNLERALCLGDELGGHIVSGHIDGIADIVSTEAEGDSVRFVFEAPAEISPFIAEKGSVCLDGVSLTVNAVDNHKFGVNIISHTQEETTFCRKQAGDPVNIEIDMLARYVARLSQSVR